MSASASIPSTILRAVLVAAGLLPAACNGVPQEVTTLGSSDSGDASTSSGPTTASSSSGHDSTATGSSSSSDSSSSGPPADSTGSSSSSTTDATSSSSSDSSSSSSSGSSGSSSTDSGSTDSGSTDSGSTDSGSTDSGSSDSGTTGGDTGYCAPTCVDAIDCAQGGNPADWSCTSDGFCEFIGVPPPCDPLSCPAAAGLACAEVDGSSYCVIPCSASGNECDPFGFECTGVTDLGDSICESPPCGGAAEGDPCFIMGFGQYGTCTGGACTCVADAECTGPGLACNL